MTTTSDARKRLAENRNTAHSAPTPAPVAVPDGGWRDGDAVVFLAFGNAQTFDRVDGTWVDRSGLYDDMDDTLVGKLEPLHVHAPRENARPEPVAAPLPSEEHDVRWIAQAIREALLSNEPGDIHERILRAAEAVHRLLAAAGYRLVPEDDEDTVRVPREEWPLSDGERRTPLSEPRRGTPPVLCRECSEEVEAYCVVTISGLSAGYRWRHVADGTHQCVPEPRRVRPYDEFDADRRLDGTR